MFWEYFNFNTIIIIAIFRVFSFVSNIFTSFHSTNALGTHAILLYQQMWLQLTCLVIFFSLFFCFETHIPFDLDSHMHKMNFHLRNWKSHFLINSEAELMAGAYNISCIRFAVCGQHNCPTMNGLAIKYITNTMQSNIRKSIQINIQHSENLCVRVLRRKSDLAFK